MGALALSKGEPGKDPDVMVSNSAVAPALTSNDGCISGMYVGPSYWYGWGGMTYMIWVVG